MSDRANSGSMLSRRTIFEGAAAAALSAASYRRVLGANERIGLGLIGFGLIGKRHLLDFKDQQDAQILAISEAHSGRRDEAVALAGGSPRGCADFRSLLDDPHVDAVVVSTPDHWHALMTMLACAAGKDVYVEKPLSLFPQEGRWMVEVARRHNRVVQVGTQQRRDRITSGSRADQGRSDRSGRGGPDVALPEHHARVRIAARWRTAG